MNIFRPFHRILLPILMGIALSMSTTLSAGPPETSGPHIFRYQDVNWFWFTASGMIVFVGADIPKFCAEDTFDMNLWDFQTNVNPSDSDLLMDHVTVDDAITFVYPASFGYEDGYIDVEELCLNVLEYGDIASGTTDGILTDNDIFAYDNDHNRRNAFKLSVHGVLYTPEGDPVMLNGGFNCTFNADPNPENAWQRCKERLTLSGK